MSTANAMEQAENIVKDVISGDVSSSSTDGHNQENVDTAALTNEEAKKKRISDAEWQKMREKSNKADEVISEKNELKKALEGAPDEVLKEEDLIPQVKKLKELVERKDWEADNPIVRSEKYRDQWKKVNSDSRLSALTYDEKFRLIKEESSTVKEELRKSERPTISVPTYSKSSTTSSYDPSKELAAKMLRDAGLDSAADRLYKA